MNTTTENNKIIAEFPNYSISKDGFVLNIKTNRVLKPSKSKYLSVSLCLNGKSFQKTIHRLVALNFIPNTDNKTDVNHIDGNKHNNHYTNLEWVTRLENNLHAVKIGLRNDNKVVLVRDVRTDNVTEYFSLAESRRALGLGKNVAEARVKTKGQKTFRDFTQFCLKSEFVNWGEVDLERDLFISGTPQRIKITNQENDEVTIYSSISEAAKALGLQSGTISFRLNRTPPVWKDEKFIFEKII